MQDLQPWKQTRARGMALIFFEPQFPSNTSRGCMHDDKTNRSLTVAQEDTGGCEEKGSHRATSDHHFPCAREEQQSAQGLEGFQVGDGLSPSPRPSMLPGQLFHHDLHVSDHGEGYAHPFGKNGLRRQLFSGRSNPNGCRGQRGKAGKHTTTGRCVISTKQELKTRRRTKFSIPNGDNLGTPVLSITWVCVRISFGTIGVVSCARLTACGPTYHGLPRCHICFCGTQQGPSTNTCARARPFYLDILFPQQHRRTRHT